MLVFIFFCDFKNVVSFFVFECILPINVVIDIIYIIINTIINAKYITHCGYSIENNIASDFRLSRNVVNKESKRSRRFVCYCDTSSGDKNYCKQGSFILYGRTVRSGP